MKSKDHNNKFIKKYIRLDGHSTYYRENLVETEIAVLFIHGWYCSSSVYQPMLNAMSDSYHVVALDLWGYGRSDKIRDGQYSLNMFQLNLKLFVEAVIPDKILVIVGHSMGGLLSLSLYFDKILPHSIAGLVFLHPIAGYGDYNIFLKTFMKMFVRSSLITRFFIKNNFEKGLSHTALKLIKENYEKTPWFVAKRTALHTFTDFSLKDSNTGLDPLPALIVGGKYDNTLSDAKKINAFLQVKGWSSRLSVLDSGHFSFLENPVKSAGLILEFLDRV